jgi:hypothetical protein
VIYVLFGSSNVRKVVAMFDCCRFRDRKCVLLDTGSIEPCPGIAGAG